MSMIKCPECGQSVSSRAPMCPHCGVPISGNVKRCPLCGGFALMDARQCPSCQARFIVNEPAKTAGGTSSAGTAVDSKATENTIEAPKTLTAAENLKVIKSPKAVEASESLQDAESPKVIEASEGPEATETPEPQELTTTSEPQKRKGLSVLAVVLITMLMLALIGGGAYALYWLNKDQMAKEEDAYTMLEGCTDPLNFEDFISRFPDSRHLDDVRARMEALQQEDSEWQSVEASMNVTRLESYMREYPHSPHEQRAQFLIDSLDYIAARNADTREGYIRYLDKHPEGNYYIEANSGRNAVEERLAREEEARRQAEAQAYADSIAAAESEQQ